MLQSNMWCCVLCYEIVSFIFYGSVIVLSVFYFMYWLQQKVNRQYLALLNKKASKMHNDPPEPDPPTDPEMTRPEVSESRTQVENQTADRAVAAAPEVAADVAEEEEENVNYKLDSVDAEYTYDGTWSCGDSLQGLRMQETK